jgi:hypothetical protein
MGSVPLFAVNELQKKIDTVLESIRIYRCVTSLGGERARPVDRARTHIDAIACVDG